MHRMTSTLHITHSTLHSTEGVQPRMWLLWSWRFALQQLIATDLRLCYKTPVLGMVWALAVPVALSVVLAVVFRRFLPVGGGSGGAYAMFLLAGLLPWNGFHAAVAGATTCLQENGALIRKSRFPRALIPCAIVLMHLVNMLPGLAVVALIGAMATGGAAPQWWLLPWALAAHVLCSMGLALAFSIGQAKYRDIKHLVGVALLLGFYATPILYTPAQLMSDPGLQALFWANPMAGIVSLYRIALLGQAVAGLPQGLSLAWLMLSTMTMAGGIFVLGWSLFGRKAATVADLV